MSARPDIVTTVCTFIRYVTQKALFCTQILTKFGNALINNAMQEMLELLDLVSSQHKHLGNTLALFNSTRPGRC